MVFSLSPAPERTIPDAADPVGITTSPPGHEETPEVSNTLPSGTHLPEQDQKAGSFGPTKDERRPLPPRPSILGNTYQAAQYSPTSLRLPKTARPQLQCSATTALSLTDIHTHSYHDGSRETSAAPAKPTTSSSFAKGFGSIKKLKGNGGSEADTTSVRSYAATLGAGGDAESLIGDVLGARQESPAWTLFGSNTEGLDPFNIATYDATENISSFDEEFDELDQLNVGEEGEGKASSSDMWIDS